MSFMKINKYFFTFIFIYEIPSTYKSDTEMIDLKNDQLFLSDDNTPDIRTFSVPPTQNFNLNASSTNEDFFGYDLSGLDFEIPKQHQPENIHKATSEEYGLYNNLEGLNDQNFVYNSINNISTINILQNDCISDLSSTFRISNNYNYIDHNKSPKIINNENNLCQIQDFTENSLKNGVSTLFHDDCEEINASNAMVNYSLKSSGNEKRVVGSYKKSADAAPKTFIKIFKEIENLKGEVSKIRKKIYKLEKKLKFKEKKYKKNLEAYSQRINNEDNDNSETSMNLLKKSAQNNDDSFIKSFSELNQFEDCIHEKIIIDNTSRNDLMVNNLNKTQYFKNTDQIFSKNKNYKNENIENNTKNYDLFHLIYDNRDESIEIKNGDHDTFGINSQIDNLIPSEKIKCSELNDKLELQNNKTKNYKDGFNDVIEILDSDHECEELSSKITRKYEKIFHSGTEIPKTRTLTFDFDVINHSKKTCCDFSGPKKVDEYSQEFLLDDNKITGNRPSSQKLDIEKQNSIVDIQDNPAQNLSVYPDSVRREVCVSYKTELFPEDSIKNPFKSSKFNSKSFIESKNQNLSPNPIFPLSKKLVGFPENSGKGTLDDSEDERIIFQSSNENELFGESNEKNYNRITEPLIGYKILEVDKLERFESHNQDQTINEISKNCFLTENSKENQEFDAVKNVENVKMADSNIYGDREQIEKGMKRYSPVNEKNSELIKLLKDMSFPLKRKCSEDNHDKKRKYI